MEETGFGIVNSSTSYLPGPDGLKPPTVQHGVENDQDEANIVMKEYKLLLLTVLKDALFNINQLQIEITKCINSV